MFIKSLQIILFAAFICSATILPCSAKAAERSTDTVQNQQPKTPIQQTNLKNLNEISKSINSISEKVEKLESQLSKERSLADINKQVSELENAVADGKKTAFDHGSTLLNILVGLTALVITALGVAFVVLAVLGFKDIKGMRQEISNDLIMKHQENIDNMNKIHQENINDLYNKASNIRDDFNKDLLELSTKVDVLGLQLRQITNGENPVALNLQIDNPNSKENAFDE
jgi:TolA-binding protein